MGRNNMLIFLKQTIAIMLSETNMHFLEKKYFLTMHPSSYRISSANNNTT